MKEDYRSCMAKNMGSGRLKGLSKEDRKIEFCSIAKQCSKNLSPEEAKKLCIEAAANPKPTRKRKSSFDLTTLASCATQKIDFASLTPENMVPTLTAALQSCSGTKVPSYKRFMNACMKEIGTGDFLTSQPDIKKCQVRWNEIRGT